MTGQRINLKGFKLDKSGKLQRTTKGKSVSQKIAEKKNPKRKYTRANT